MGETRREPDTTERPGTGDTDGRRSEASLELEASNHFRCALEELGYDTGDAFETLLQESSDGVFLFDREVNFRSSNRRGLELIGWSREELMGKPVLVTLPDDEVEPFRERLARIRRGEALPVYERKLQRGDGSEITVEVSTSILRSSDGELRAILSVLRDITERQQNDAFIRHLVEGVTPIIGDDFFLGLARSLADALDVIGVGVCQPDEKDPQFLVSLALCMGGKAGGEIRYESVHSPCHEVIGGATVHVPSDVQRRFPQHPFFTEHGIESYLGIPLFAQNGECLGLIFVVDDEPLKISSDHWVLRVFAERAAAELERRISRRELRREERRRRRLLEHLPAVLYEGNLDPEQPLDFVAPGIEVLTGYTVEEWSVPLEQFLPIIVEEDRDWVGTRILRKLELKEPYHLEYRIRRKDGSIMWIRDQASPFESEGHELLVGVLVDVTSQRLLEEQAANTRRLESVGQLAAGVAHDFNNLLMSSIGQLSLAKTEAPSAAEGSDRLDAVEKTLLRATGLTRQLLSLAKGGEPVRRPGSITTLLEETVEFTVSGSRISPELFIDEGLWKVEVDQGQLRQVVENLVLNAIQAMPGGGVLTVVASNVELGSEQHVPLDAGRYVKVSVRDEGVGIEPDTLPHIFDPYFTTKTKGFGLGLASSHAIIRRHDGHLMADSVRGEGTTFTFLLPASDAVPDRQREDREREIGGVSLGGRALVLDDEPAVLDVVSAMLQSLDFEVTMVSRGEQALEVAREARESGEGFQLALLDLTVAGGMGGEEAAEQLREIDPSMKLVVTSGYSDSQAMARFAEHGFDECLPKPYTLAEIERTVRRVLAEP